MRYGKTGGLNTLFSQWPTKTNGKTPMNKQVNHR
jgi:hypothetical protein